MSRDRYGEQIDEQPAGSAEVWDEDGAVLAEQAAKFDTDDCRCVNGWIEEQGDGDRWYPCKRHNEERFWRWLRGHFHPEHDPYLCDECLTIIRGGKRKPQRAGGRHDG